MSITLNTSIVSVEWLHQHLDASNLVVLDATISKKSGDGIRIPKARFFSIKQKFSDVSAQFPNTFPNKEQFQDEARKLRINKDSAIIVYDDKGIYSSPRAWWLFKCFGFENVAVLDGGLPQWQLKGFNTTSYTVEVYDYGNFDAELNPSLITDFEGLQSFIESPNSLILDARSKARFNCEVPEPREGLRSGTITNSKNLPYTELLDGYCLKSTKELSEIFSKLVTGESTLVFSCGSGITACILALAATECNFESLTVYDGSWTEYGTLTDKQMNDNHWTRDELIAYILLYASHSDLIEDNHERNVIISKVDMQTFQKIHDEFDNDNDYQSIQKILKGIEEHNYSKEDISLLLADIKVLFFSDGDYDVMERYMLNTFKKLLN
ncbi:rhodanese-like domain-containing protein [Winogradskyella sp. 3972H.M.0a.05]|uniref:sulfurtransferase n=1 Tax=Winogradskyella sp. 3972H.M.0a.05 TaxID=2950277 RepID=UPI00339B4184